MPYPPVVLLSLWLAALVWRPLAADDAVPSPWRGSGLGVAVLDERLTNARCRRDELAFLGCVGAVQGVLDAEGRERHFLPAAAVPRRGPATVVARFGPAVVVEDASQRLRAEGNALAVVRAHRQRIERWRERLGPGLMSEVDVGAVREWLKREVITPEHLEALAAALVNGELAVADAHARIVPAAPAGNGQGAGTSAGSGGQPLVYTGIGAGIQPIIDAAMVTSVVRGGPAASAGVRVQDFLLAIDGASTEGLSAQALVGRLRGKRGSAVALTLKRQAEVFEVRVTRDAVQVKNVSAHSLIDRGWQLAYLKIDSFLDPGTCREVRRALDGLLKPTLNGLLLDLRDNSGGLIDQAVCVADLFLAEGETVLEVRQVADPAQREPIRTRAAARVRVPMVTLVNASTGSASEVLAGALQDHGRSLVVGERTFGKGTVQTLRPWSGSRSIRELFTAARYHRPSGVGVQLVGIAPDLPATDRPEGLGRASVALREGDLFPTALPPELGTWRPPDPERVATIAECASTEGLASKRLRREQAKGNVTDHLLAVGQDALVCALSRPP
jgi:C-terminal peptidase prc